MSQIKIKQIKELSGSTTANNGDYLAWNTTLGKFEPQSQPLDGEKGAQGDKGAQGTQGDKGAQGPQGIQGITGATGPQGIDGDHWTSLPGNPGALQGVNVGDQYLNTDDGTVFEWDGNVWNPTGNIQGPQGAKGDIGEKGAQGIQGEKGAQGPQGIQGITGATGPTGPQGLQGITGATGPTGPTGPGFTTVANPSIHRILTSDGTPDGAIAESSFTFDASSAHFQTGNIMSGYWALDDYIKWESHVFNSNMKFDAGGNAGYGAQASLLIEEAVMVPDFLMDEPVPMVWDNVKNGVGYQISSRRFKENIVDLEFDHSLLFNEVRGVKYTGLESDRVQVGFIAEEVEKFDPAIVIHDSEGKPFSLDYGRMVPVLFEVIRDLRSRIEKLEQK